MKLLHSQNSRNLSYIPTKTNLNTPMSIQQTPPLTHQQDLQTLSLQKQNLISQNPTLKLKHIQKDQVT